MSEKNNKKQEAEQSGKFSFSEFIRKKQVIAGIIIVFIILIIIISVVFANSKKQNNSKNNKSHPTSSPTALVTKKPIQLPTTNAAVTPSEQVETTPEHTEENTSLPPATSAPAPSAQPSFNPKEEKDMNEILENSNAETVMKAIQQKRNTLEKQDNFEAYMQSQDYNNAKELLDNFFKDDKYANLSLITYKNYVKFYEEQELYNDSAIYQLNYIEEKDGLENVREESEHYKMLMSTLEKIPDFTDSRLNTIKYSVTTWKEMTDAINSKNYETVINTTKNYIKNGNDCVTAYLYLTQALDYQEEYFEEAKVYYCYLGKDTNNMNQLEFSYFSMFTEKINFLSFNEKITSDEVNYLETEFDYANYLK